MGASHHLLRIEGVNHTPVLDDTDDISTRRGGSAMLRDAPADLPRLFPDLKTVSLEASVGLFEAKTDDPDRLVVRIATRLAKDVPHITFVVDSAPLVGDDFAAALREVTARNRFRQFRQPTVAVPEAAGSDARVCDLDRLRPAADTLPKGDTKIWVSASVRDRRKKGGIERNRFLQEKLELETEVPTTSSLLDLAAEEDKNHKRFGNLADKMAVIYADGNGFGKIKRALLQDRQQLRDFDNRVQALHKAFLRDLVESARHDDDFRNGKDLRLEVLLWGGDELMLVTPAWKGMETLQRFFETVEAEVPAEDLAEEARKPTLTYAAGLVFCGANTPISEIVRTVKGLAEAVKGVEHAKNRFDYLVLESVDYPTQGIEQFRRLHFGAEASKALAPLAPLTSGSRREGIEHVPWPVRIKETAAFLDRCPRGAIRDLAQHWVRMRDKPTDPGHRKDFQGRADRFLEIYKKYFVDELYQRLFDHFVPDHVPALGPDHAGWLHLTELWDYLAPLPAKPGRTAP